MNLLSHYHILRESESSIDDYIVAGSVLPDLIKHLNPEARGYSSHRPIELSGLQGDFRSLSYGINHHIQVDSIFHKSIGFIELARDICNLLDDSGSIGPGENGDTLAHVLAEICIDGHLIGDDPTLTDQYYAAMESIDRTVLTEFCDQIIGVPITAKEYDRIIRDYLIYEYVNDECVIEVIDRINKVLVGRHPRAGFKIEWEALRGVLPEIREKVREKYQTLIAQVTDKLYDPGNIT